MNCLEVGIVPTFNYLKVGIVPIFNQLKVGTEPASNHLKVGTVPTFDNFQNDISRGIRFAVTQFYDERRRGWGKKERRKNTSK